MLQGSGLHRGRERQVLGSPHGCGVPVRWAWLAGPIDTYRSLFACDLLFDSD